MTALLKNTNNDKRGILNKAVRAKFERAYVMDFDDTFVYYEVYREDESYHLSGYEDFKVSYSISDIVNVTLGDDPVRVERLTEYKEVTKELEKDMGEKIMGFLEKHFSSSKSNTKAIIKQFEEEEMIAIEPLYIAVGEVDSDGDTIETMEEMESLVKSFNEANDAGTLQSSLFHNHKTESFSVVKAWVNQTPCFIGDNLIKEGQPIAKIQFNNKKAWELRKNGTLMGLSIGARATEVEMVDE